MSNLLRIAAIACLIGGGWVGVASAAEPFAHRGELAIGKPPRTTTVSLTASDQGVVLETERAHALLPLAAPEHADLQAVKLAGGHHVGVVRVRGAGGEAAAAILVRRPGEALSVLWSGALDARGDPGERRGHAVEVGDRTGDGHPDLIIAEVSEAARICGQNRTLLRPRAIDPTTLRLRPVLLSRLAPASSPPREVTLTTESGGATPPPLARRLRLSAVSSQPGSAEPWLTTPTTSLTDGDLATYWAAVHGGGGRGEFASFRFDGAGLAIRAIAVVPLPEELPDAQRVSVARALWLVGDDGERLKLTLPARLEPGQRYFAQLDPPLEWTCASLVFEETSPRRPGRSGPAVLAEVEVYTELDFGGGAGQLVEQLAAGGAAADRAANLLSTIGPIALGELRSAWSGLPAAARRRGVRVAAAYAGAHGEARSLLARALDDADAAVQQSAFEALLASGPEARGLLLPRIAIGGERADRAALALAREAPREAIGALLSALAAEDAANRAALRQAIVAACRRGGPEVLAAVRAFAAGQDAGVASRAALAMALSAVRTGTAARELASEIATATAPDARAFEDRWRLLQAARALPSSPELDAWLAGLVEDADPWMLRAGSITALSERGSERTPQVAASALRDPYPRVRAAAAAALAPHPSALKPLAERALRDRWPMVRATALEALAEQPGAGPILREALGDPSRKGRAAAIRALGASRARDAWPLVERRLTDAEEWPEVLAAGIGFARALCIREAEPALLELLRRGTKPDAWAPDADLAMQAFEALIQLGGEPAQAATRIANAASAPAALRLAAQAARRDTEGRCAE